ERLEFRAEDTEREFVLRVTRRPVGHFVAVIDSRQPGPFARGPESRLPSPAPERSPVVTHPPGPLLSGLERSVGLEERQTRDFLPGVRVEERPESEGRAGGVVPREYANRVLRPLETRHLAPATDGDLEFGPYRLLQRFRERRPDGRVGVEEPGGRDLLLHGQ